ncbi:hydroxyacid dehydrogenase [Oryzifoliimicrobium ureilyticus]|uniref:hydroxyacid dehydrogenase n=1 Tax=Oryzifoliimicrobium ureilyticus TaxID=3113724 RepID=UPI003076462D
MTGPVITIAMDRKRTTYVLPDRLKERLGSLGRLSTSFPLQDLSATDLPIAVHETEILVTGWGAPRIDAAFLRQMPQLKMIAHAAGTVKGLIDGSVFDAGIVVTHAADANAQPVAEFTLAAILFAGKKVFRFRDLYINDRGRARTRTMQAEPIGNYRRIIGLIGASKIGRRVIQLLKPFDYQILLYDPFVSEAEAADLGVTLSSLENLMAESDIVSVHAPSLASTRHMINDDLLSSMKEGATFINTARGALVDEAALLKHLRVGRIDAIIDVTEPEIPQQNSDFYDLPNVFLTPHIAGAIGLEQTRLGEMAVDEVARFINGERLHHAICKKDLEYMA